MPPFSGIRPGRRVHAAIRAGASHELRQPCAQAPQAARLTQRRSLRERAASWVRRRPYRPQG